MNTLFVTFLYSGLLKPAPGTWGSFAAVIAAVAIYVVAGLWGVGVALAVIWVFSLNAIETYMTRNNSHDPSEVVIDEVVGQWIALLPVFIMTNALTIGAVPYWIAAFGLFRLFDITKPGWVGTFDRRDDAVGVLFDDVVAGAFAAVGVCALIVLAGILA